MPVVTAGERSSMLMLRMPDADATMLSLPKGASKLPLTIASTGAAHKVW